MRRRLVQTVVGLAEEKVAGENLPVTVLLTFQNFKVEEKLQRAPAVAAATKPTTEGTESRRGNP